MPSKSRRARRSHKSPCSSLPRWSSCRARRWPSASSCECRRNNEETDMDQIPFLIWRRNGDDFHDLPLPMTRLVPHPPSARLMSGKSHQRQWLMPPAGGCRTAHTGRRCEVLLTSHRACARDTAFRFLLRSLRFSPEMQTKYAGANEVSSEKALPINSKLLLDLAVMEGSVARIAN